MSFICVQMMRKKRRSDTVLEMMYRIEIRPLYFLNTRVRKEEMTFALKSKKKRRPTRPLKSHFENKNRRGEKALDTKHDITTLPFHWAFIYT